MFLLLSTVLYDGSLFQYFKSAGNVIGVTLLIDLLISNGRYESIRDVGNYLIFLTYANLLSIIMLYPNGFGSELYKGAEYLLGIDNRFLYTFFPMICVNVWYDLYSKGKITTKTIIAFSVAFGTLIWFWSVGAIVSLFIFILYYILIYKKELTILPYAKLLLLIIIAINIFVVVLRQYDLFVNLITNYFNKDVSFSGRTFLWNRAFLLFSQYKEIGFGIHTDEELLKIFGYVTPPHNHFLYILYTSGIVGITLFILELFIVCNQLDKAKDIKLAVFFSFALFSIFLALVFDSFDYSCGLAMVLALANNINIIDNRKVKQKAVYK